MHNTLQSRVGGPWRSARLDRLVALAVICSAGSCSTPLPSEPTQRAMFDRSIANALIGMTTGLVRRHIAGDLRGRVDLTVSCQDGGTAAITGNISTAPSGITTRDLTFVMDACYRIDSIPRGYGTDVRSVRATGSIRRIADFGDAFIGASYESSGLLDVSGALHLVINSVTYLDHSIRDSCAFSANDAPTRSAGSYCGRPFSY